MSPQHLSIRVQTTLNHIRFVFYYNIKDSEINICLENWKHRLGLESARAALCKWAACTRQIFLSKTFTNSLNMQKQYEKNVWETSNGTYLLSVRVQTTINHISICFFTTISTSKKMFFFRARAEKGIAWHIDASSVVWTLKDFCCFNVSMLCYKTNGKRHSEYYLTMMVNAIACTVEF